MNRPRLLFLSHRLPYPPHNGAAIRSFNVLRLLARHYDVSAICFDRRDEATAHVSMDDRLAGVAELGNFDVYPIPQEGNVARLVWDHARSVVSGRAYTYFVHDSDAFTHAVHRVLTAGEPALVHVDSLDLVRHLGWLPIRRTILTHHNTESLLLHRRALAERSWGRRQYLRLQARLVRREERRWVPRVALNAVVSPQDAAELRRIAGEAKFCIVPNGVDTDFFKPEERAREGIVFVGGTSYFPNLDALEWFESEILPILRHRGCTAPVTFVGRATKEERARYDGRDGLTLTGYVDDVRPFLNAAACFIAPLRVGGGTRLKLVDAWAMGKAVVSTTIGAEGLEVCEGTNVLLRDSAAEFAAGIIDVLTLPPLRRRLEHGARQTAELIYSWDVIEREMISAYETVRSGAGGT